MVFWLTAVIYGIGVVFFFFAVSGDKQPWADGTEAVHKEDVPYSKEGKNEEEKKPLMDDNRQSDDQDGGEDGGQTVTAAEGQPEEKK